MLPAELEISSWIAGWSQRSPDKLAIRFEDQQISFRAMERRVARLAGALARHEAIAEGDRVAYLGQNAPELLDLLFACARLGAILLPLSARMPGPEPATVARPRDLSPRAARMRRVACSRRIPGTGEHYRAGR